MDLADKLTWSKPEKVLTKFGSRWKKRCLLDPEFATGFWAFWKTNSDYMKKQGYSVSKNKDTREWFITHWATSREDLIGEVPEAEVVLESDLPKRKVKKNKGLHPWQVDAVARLAASIEKHGSAMDGSDTGVGKTYSAIGTARELGLKIGIVCPKAVQESWKRVAENHFGVVPEFVVNYESLRTGNRKAIGTWKMIANKNGGRRKKVFEYCIPKNTLIIFDESHKLKGKTSLNSKLGIFAKEQGYKILMASATSAINPMDMRAMGYILGLHNNTSFWSWVRRNGCYQGRFGYTFNGDTEILRNLHKDVFLDRGIRLRRDEIPGFPECDVHSIAYDMDTTDTKQITQVFFEMKAELGKLNKIAKTEKEKQANSLVVQLRARQKCELIKVPLFVELAEEALENGMSIVLFMNFKDSIDALAERLKTKCIIDGRNKPKERQSNIDDFQNDKKRVIIVNAQAGGAGISLHDLNGKYPRMALISPSYSAIILKQCLGRVHRDGSKTKALQRIVFVANTVEEEVCEKVKDKLHNLDLINDGVLSLDNEKLFERK